MSQKHDDLHYLVNKIYTLLEEGCNENSTLEKVNDALESEWGFENDLYDNLEDYQNDLKVFNKVADYFATVSQE